MTFGSELLSTKNPSLYFTEKYIAGHYMSALQKLDGISLFNVTCATF